MEKIIKDSKFQAVLKEIAEAEGRGFLEVQKEGADCIAELYAQQHPVATMLGAQTIQYIVSRAYENKIDVDPKGVQALMKLVRKHSVAFIMTHKTYLDTMILALTLVRYGMPVPYAFGGDNMAFLGLKQLGKAAGLIFIRRDFKSDKVYKAALRHFIAFLIDDGQHFTWNIEGTRSRTGKIVWPQMGILKYIMDGERNSKREIKYIPVSIVYDLIPDVKEMTEQGKGKAKNSENLIWFTNYVKKLGNQFGRAAIRFGEPVDADGLHQAIIPDMEEDSYADKNTLPRFAFEVIHKANRITPVTTVSLICHLLLNHFSLTKKEMEIRVSKLMRFIEKRREDVLLDRGKPIGKSIQRALNLLIKGGIVEKTQSGLHAQYCLASSEYLPANYYANMSSGHLYHRAFIELALVKIADDTSNDRIINFWTEIMRLRDLFKFEFFYTNKENFSNEIEEELQRFDPKWRDIISNPKGDIKALLRRQNLFVSESVVLIYLEAYQVVCTTLIGWDVENEFTEKGFIDACLFKGKDLHWQGKIRRLDSVSKPFLINGYRLAKNRQLTPCEDGKIDQKGIKDCIDTLKATNNRLSQLHNLEEVIVIEENQAVPLEMSVVPGSALADVAIDVLQAEEGSQIAAFFDLDRTLIDDFSVKQFMRSRVFSGRTSPREFLSQFAAVLYYASGNRDFGRLTNISAKGIKGLKEKDFVELGEDVYLRYLAGAIYPESRALVDSHLAKGHKVAIISAATPYQVDPIARDLGIKNVFCTRMQVVNGKFTGEIEEMCWAEGKANAAREFSEKHNIDLSKSYFYTDSIDDYPLLEIVGNPQAVNPDKELSQRAFENSWQIRRFDHAVGTPLVNSMRTVLAIGSFYPAAMKGLAVGAMNMSQRKGINTTIESVGDLGCRMAGLEVSVRGIENLEVARPAVVCFNHQSNVDMFILSKIVKRDLTAIAKKELASTPLGPLFKAMGAIFIDRSNKNKALKAFEPAIEALKSGICVAIAPEGTRSRTRKLGKFKKGAFHLAMQAGVPIVPIVIKNAHDAMPRGSGLMQATHIEVVVLEAVDTSNWKVETIKEHIKEVRGLYLETLGQVE